MMRVVVRAVQDVPQVRLVPQHRQPHRKVERVEKAAPAVLTELHQRRRLVLGFAPSPPSLNKSLIQVKLFR